jgi:branched-chain amino acid transport system ATP-binding protein
VGAGIEPRAICVMLTVSDISTSYGESEVLFGVSMTVGAGEVVALLGANGAGKTTTLRSILGLTSAHKGSISFDGMDITRAPPHQISRAGISWVPDDRRIFPMLTVKRNLDIARKSTRFRAWNDAALFEIFSALEYLYDRECENMSGGEQQMVSIARALVGSPGLILLDEPSQGLAPSVQQDVLALIRKLKQEGIAILLVEQDALSALEISDRVYVLDMGRIVHEGPASELLASNDKRRLLLGI